VAVVSLGYRRADVAHSLNGFGFLVPRAAGMKILAQSGTPLSSESCAKRSRPTDSFLGGATDPDTVSLSDSSLVDLAHRELTPVLGLKARPTVFRVTAYEKAIPQYNLGHTARIATIRADLANVPGLYLVGTICADPPSARASSKHRTLPNPSERAADAPLSELLVKHSLQTAHTETPASRPSNPPQASRFGCGAPSPRC